MPVPSQTQRASVPVANLMLFLVAMAMAAVIVGWLTAKSSLNQIGQDFWKV
jgi:archaellum component FlaG (FlaF/FlaG flagellin family)